MKKLLIFSMIAVLAVGGFAQGKKNAPKPRTSKMMKMSTGGQAATPKQATAKSGKATQGMKMRHHGRMVHPGILMDRRFARLMLKGDARGLSRMYASNAILIPPDTDAVKGRSNIEKTFGDLFKMVKVTKFELHEIRHDMSGGTCVGAGTVDMTVIPNGGTETTNTFRFTEVAKNIKGHWLYTYDHVSLKANMGAPPAGK